jgi:prephenate dehydrogenase
VFAIFMHNNITLIGTGLIGASIVLALKKANAAIHVVGVDRDTDTLRDAKSSGAIDAIGTLDDIAQADVVIVAIPVRQMPTLFDSLLPHLQANTIIIDVGSTKQDVIAAARTALGAKVSQFVPCHPIAGRERHGPLAAEADLFVGKNIVVTPLAENAASTLQVVRDLWALTGATIVEMSPAAHDAVFAAVSHLPHMLAFALVDELASRPNAKTLFEHAASGFRDFTRIASSSPEMWRDVALNNRTALLAELDAYLAKATDLRNALHDNDEANLFALMQRAQTAREQWLSKQFEQFNDIPVNEEAR